MLLNVWEEWNVMEILRESTELAHQPKIPTPSIKHYAQIHKTQHIHQQQIKMGKITNSMKEVGHAELYSTEQLLEALSSGHCVLLSNFEVDAQNGFRFVSSSAFAIDIDDDLQVTDPLQVLEELKDICVGLFYTFSHGRKGNRYRLVFSLDESITDLEDMKLLINYVADYLKGEGLPIDEHTGIRTPLSIIRPGVKGYEVNSLDTTLKVSEWLPKAKIKEAVRLEIVKEELKARSQQLNRDLLNPVTFDELKEMIEKIGYISSGGGAEETNKWLQIVYALKNEVINGGLDESQGFELFSIVSGPETDERYWNSLKPQGRVTVGTIIHLANDYGYKRSHKYNYALHETPENIPIERIKSKGYITTDLAKQLLQRNQKLLVESPTGSGKTTAYINAFKELANKEYHYYIFAAPTISLTEQIGKEHKVTYVTGGMKNLRNMITNKAIDTNKPERIFICTFDKASELMYHLTSNISYGPGKEPTFTIVIDEIHKHTEAYNYRYAAIDQLEEVSKMATSVIGLSGTVEDILKDKFEALIKIDTGNTKSPCLDFRVFTYHTRQKQVSEENNQHLADVMMIPVIKGLLKQTRVLVFVNNKERIKMLAKVLRKDGITVQTITSDSKKSSTYVNIVENRAIDGDVQVVLTTTVIADGISIQNGLDWSCLVVSDKASPIFNPSTIKQISNRFRENYRYFCLYTRELNPNYSEIKPFQIESDFVYRKRMVESYVDYLNVEFVAETLQEFSPSKVEKNNGIFYKSTEDDAIIEYNPLFVRHQSMKRKESYYSAFRQAFINEVGKQLGVKCSGVVNVNEEAEKSNQDMSGLLAELEAEHEQKKKEDKELRDGFSQYFDESIYGCFVRDDEEALKLFKEDVHSTQYRALTRICRIADYETCKQVVGNIQKNADTHKYFTDIQSLVEIAEFEHTNKVHITKKVYKELLRMAGGNYTSKDFKDVTERTISKKLKVKPEDVKAALKLFHRNSFKKNGESHTNIVPLNVKIVANRHATVTDSGIQLLEELSVENSILRYVWNRPEKQQAKMLTAIDEKYGINQHDKRYQDLGI